MEDALTEQIKERQETERKLQRLSKQVYITIINCA
jgi:hypothetical protein